MIFTNTVVTSFVDVPHDHSLEFTLIAGASLCAMAVGKYEPFVATCGVLVFFSACRKMSEKWEEMERRREFARNIQFLRDLIGATYRIDVVWLKGVNRSKFDRISSLLKCVKIGHLDLCLPSGPTCTETFRCVHYYYREIILNSTRSWPLKKRVREEASGIPIPCPLSREIVGLLTSSFRLLLSIYSKCSRWMNAFSFRYLTKEAKTINADDTWVL